MKGIKDLVTSFPALQEFGKYAQAIKPVMTDSNISRDIKRQTLNDLVNNLSEKSLQNDKVAEQIMIIINMEKEVSKEYEDTEAQVNGILSWLPKFEYHRDKLVKEISKRRKIYGLKE